LVFLLASLLAPKKKSIREPAVRPPRRPRRQVTAARDKHGYFFRHKLGSERRQLFRPAFRLPVLGSDILALEIAGFF
jgi:hypothetical protein